VIILSGVLVLVAIALLIVGVVSGNSGTEIAGLSGMDLIYVSIGVSIVSALFLAIGVFLRRKDLFGSVPVRSGGSAAQPARHSRRGKADKASAVPDTIPRPGTTPAEGVGDDASSGVGVEEIPPPVDVPADAIVYVVPGRRRYHLDSCRQLAGRGKQELTFEEAREEGFSPCTACMPDTALAARASASAGDSLAPDLARGISTQDTEADTTDATATKDGGTEAQEERPGDVGPESESSDDERDTAAANVGANGSAGAFASPAQWASDEDTATDEAPTGSLTDPIGVSGAESADDTSADDRSAESRAGEASDEAASGEDGRDTAEPDAENPDGEPENGKTEPDSGRAESDNSAPGKGASQVAEVPQQAAPKEADGSAHVADGPQVRILSGTKRYHRPDCALIEDIGDESDDLESLSRAEAKARGCTPCLVCQPDKEPVARD
jgi:hypothetical protein